MSKKGIKNNDIDFTKMKKVKYKNNHINSGFHFYLSYNTRIILFTILIILLCICSYISINKSFAVYETNKLEYSENGSVNYSISLKENDYYSKSTLDSGRQYVSSLIDKIETTFKYNTFFSDKLILANNYTITGKLNVYSEEGNILLDEDYDLYTSPLDYRVSDKFNIVHELSIDYGKYNTIAENYTKEYNLENSRSEFVVTMLIDYEGNYSKFYDEEVKRKTKLVMTIPLLKDSITIGIDDSGLKNNAEITETKLRSGIDNIYSYFGSGFLILATIVAIYLISFIINSHPKKTKYCRLRDGYLQEYDRVIVTTKTLPRFTEFNVIDCYNFKELLDAEEVLELPINYYEIVKNQKCVFYIVNGKDVYKYVLKECDVEY